LPPNGNCVFRLLHEEQQRVSESLIRYGLLRIYFDRFAKDLDSIVGLLTDPQATQFIGGPLSALDAGKLLNLLLRYHGGEKKLWREIIEAPRGVNVLRRRQIIG